MGNVMRSSRKLSIIGAFAVNSPMGFTYLHHVDRAHMEASLGALAVSR